MPEFQHKMKRTSYYPPVTLVVMLDIKKKRLGLIDMVLTMRRNSLFSKGEVGHITEHFPECS